MLNISRDDYREIKSINVHLEVSGDGSASGVGQVDHVFSVGLGGSGGLLGVPDGLHLGEVGAVLKHRN